MGQIQPNNVFAGQYARSAQARQPSASTRRRAGGKTHRVRLGPTRLASPFLTLETGLDRGIPAGYINTLEKRLAETERALFFALTEIHAGVVAHDDYESPALRRTMGVSLLSGTAPTTQQDKAGLTASWSKAPLINRRQAQEWFEDKTKEAAVPASVNSGARGGLDDVAPATTSEVSSPSSGRPVAHLHQTRHTEAVSGGAFATGIVEPRSSVDPTRDIQGRFSGWAESHREGPVFGPRNEGVIPSASDTSPVSKARDLARGNPSLYF